MFPANPPTARTNRVASASELRGASGVRSTPIRPMTNASITGRWKASLQVLLDGGPEGQGTRARLVRPVPHPQAERREVGVVHADPDADRALEEGVGLGQHADAVVTVGVTGNLAVEGTALAGHRPPLEQVIHLAVDMPARL